MFCVSLLSSGEKTTKAASVALFFACRCANDLGLNERQAIGLEIVDERQMRFKHLDIRKRIALASMRRKTRNHLSNRRHIFVIPGDDLALCQPAISKKHIRGKAFAFGLPMSMIRHCLSDPFTRYREGIN